MPVATLVNLNIYIKRSLDKIFIALLCIKNQLFCVLQLYALRTLSDWLEAATQLRAEWRSVSLSPGAPSVTRTGATRMLWWSAASWDSLDSVRFHEM